jgi:MFS transporter, DHA1 family, multidrug resistance protein
MISVDSRTRRVLWLLFASLALMETGYGIIYPVFAKRLETLGAGVDALGYMAVAFATGQLIFAPILGSLADRYGRKPFILLGLISVIVANILFLLSDSVPLYIGLRFFQGALTAGLLPAAMGIVADLVPEQERGRWGGIVMGGYGAGFILGPAVGGLLYDNLGFQAPFISSAIAGAVATLLAFLLIPETRKTDAVSTKKREDSASEPFFKSLPRPFYILITLFVLSFLDTFVFAFVEPQMVFYFYDTLHLSTTQFGVIVGAYGLALTLAQTTLGHLSDRFGRAAIIALGFGLNVPFYVGLLLFTNFWLLLLLALLGGLGIGLSSPAASAYYLDISSEAHSSRVIGLKEAAGAAGMIAGPLLVAVLSRLLSAQHIFRTSAVLTGLAVLLAFFVLRTYQVRKRPIVIDSPSETI